MSDNNESKGRKNLIPFSERTEEEQRDIRSKGGKASGKARRKKKFLRDMLYTALMMRLKDLPDKLSKDARQQLGFKEGDTVGDAIIGRLIERAMGGDMRAIRFIFDTMGESTDVLQREQEIKIKKFSACDGFTELTKDLDLERG
ncbi:hypothetical protein [Mitsuokella multacida]|uniref:hypothetical protein n=1 Tax=Mitsuokella multacida TaxID=52226 RepID=UPI001F1C84A8|nr:hypothetical protein [Mitsuokella multacida]MCF2583630.1 hypothetical protein [Mitsuokella multacida]